MSGQRNREREIQSRIARQQTRPRAVPSTRQRQQMISNRSNALGRPSGRFVRPVARQAQAVRRPVSNVAAAKLPFIGKTTHPLLAGRPDKGHITYKVPQPSTDRHFTIYSLPTCGYSVEATKLIHLYPGKKKLDAQIHLVKPILKKLSNEHRVNLTEAKKILFTELQPSVGDHFTYPIIYVNENTENGKEVKFVGGYNEFCAYLGITPKKFDY